MKDSVTLIRVTLREGDYDLDKTNVTLAVDVAMLHTPSAKELEATHPSTDDVILVSGAHSQSADRKIV